jgi:peptidoglycan hydrolase CwlO-like protein
MKRKLLKTVLTLVVILIILLNVSYTRQNRLMERKAALPIYLLVRSPRNLKKEESSQSLQRLLLMLQKSLDSVQVQVDKANKENKSGFHYEMLVMELSVSLGEFSKI